MDAVFLVSFLVGGFFVLLSLFGGGDGDADVDAGHDADMDLDGHDIAAGSGFVELLTLRALFLFATFFGLTGLLLSWAGIGGAYGALLAVLTGLVAGLGGNFLIRRVGYAQVTSSLTPDDLKGRTGKVLIPFEGTEGGKISLVSKGNRLQLRARAFGGESLDSFRSGDEVVVVRMVGSVAEVVKPE